MANISLLTARALALLLLVGALLNPYHMAPWASAFQEFAVLFALLFFCLSLAITKSTLQIPSLKWITAVWAIGLLSMLTFATGNPIQTESHYLFLAYTTVVYLAVAAGRLCANNKTIKFVFCLALVLVSFGQITVSMQQWLGSVTTVSLDNWWSTSGNAGERASGNIFQANNYGTLVIWGYLAWLFVLDDLDHRKQRISIFTVSVVAIFFAFGLALGQSRVSILGLSLVTLLGMVHLYQFSLRIRFAAVLFLIGVGVFWFLQPVLVNLLFGGDTQAQARSFIGTNVRFPLWAMFLTASTDSIAHFLFGRGWGANGSVHTAMAGVSIDFPDLGVTFAHTHNVFLDVLVSFGLIGLVMFTYLLWRVLRHFIHREVRSDNFYLWAMLIALFVHANLELPHWYGYFIWPAAFIFGALIKPSGGWVIQRWLVLPVLVAMIGLSTFAFSRYIHFEKAFGAYAIQLAQRGVIVEVFHVGTPIFPGLSEALDVATIKINKELTPEDLKRLAQVTTFSPSSFNVTRAYYASAFLKDVARYEFFSRVACGIYGYEFAARMHTISMTIPVEMIRREIQPNCSLAADHPKI